MFISKLMLEKACTQGIISKEQLENLIAFFEKENIKAETPQKFNIETVLYYGGSIIALGAMIYYMYDLVNSSTYGIILTLSIIYSLIFYFSAEFMWKKNYKTPAGLLYLLFIVSVAYVVTVITKMTGLYPKFSQAHLYNDFYKASKPALTVISALTFFTGYIVLKKRPASILTLPVAGALYNIGYMCIPDMLRQIPHVTSAGAIYGLAFSIALLAAAYKTDRKYSVDYAKWLYITGCMLLYISFSELVFDIFGAGQHDYLRRFVMLLFNLLLLIMSVLIRRNIFLLSGGIGFFVYIVDLEISYLSELKADSFVKITCVIITGLLAVFAGIVYKNHFGKVEAAVEKLVPAKFRKNLPKYR